MIKKRNLLWPQQNIVLVDDDPFSISYFKDLLKKFKECNVKYFSSISPNFFEYTNSNHIDLFIMDIVLGKYEKDGIKISEELICKKQGSIFFFVSGYNYIDNDFKHLNGKCVYDFMSKPVDAQCFGIVVSTLLNIAKTYQHVRDPFKEDIFCKEEVQIDEMRKKYLDLLDQDKTIIKKLKASSLALQINK